MKYYSRLNQYKASNLIYDCESDSAWSYDWYCLAKRFNGVMIVNNYSYSPTTVKHYYKIRKLSNEMGIEYKTIEAPRGLQNLASAMAHYISLSENLTRYIAKPRIRHVNRKKAINDISIVHDTISFLDQLIKNRG
jgi:hypothetical protein